MAKLTESGRQALAVFLRNSRARLAPAPASAAALRRRRTRGLRREEIAELANISVTWYTWLEQARNVSVSSATLSRLSRALQLSAAERKYLFELSAMRDPDAYETEDTDRRHVELQEVVDAISVPAYILDRDWNVEAVNGGAAHLFSEWSTYSRANLLRYVFLDEKAKLLILDWEDRALRVIAEFRADSSRRIGDSRLLRLIEELSAKSHFFRVAWNEHAVVDREGGLRSFNHPEDGILKFNQITFTLATAKDRKLVILIPVASARQL